MIRHTVLYLTIVLLYELSDHDFGVRKEKEKREVVVYSPVTLIRPELHTFLIAC